MHSDILGCLLEIGVIWGHEPQNYVEMKDFGMKISQLEKTRFESGKEQLDSAFPPIACCLILS